jgi:hypothetical protein
MSSLAKEANTSILLDKFEDSSNINNNEDRTKFYEQVANI